VIAGFDTKKQALEALEILKEEQDPNYAQKKLFRKQVCSQAGRITIDNGNHNMFAKFRMPDGKIVTKIWLDRYCTKHGFSKESAERI